MTDSGSGEARTAEPQFSLARSVFYALGAGVLVLAVATPIVVVLSHSSPTAALVVAVLAVIVMVAVIALVSKRMLRDIQQRIDELKAARQPDGDRTE